jgi:hypothetical protein
MSERIKTLLDAVALLASDPSKQLQHLRELGLPEGIDELALEYDAIAAAADDMLQLGELDRQQFDSVRKLDGLLSCMSGEANSMLWTAESLSSAREWQEVRSVAKECLRHLEVGR